MGLKNGDVVVVIMMFIVACCGFYIGMIYERDKMPRVESDGRNTKEIYNGNEDGRH